jgi:hypothetical protein
VRQHFAPDAKSRDIRKAWFGPFYGFIAVGGLTADFPAGLRLEQMAQETAYYLVVVNYENTKMVHVKPLQPE